jgi:hypothetical protein
MTRLWTPTEANRTLPLVRRVVADILDKGNALRELVRQPEDRERRLRIGELERELHGHLRELHAIGCDYKDAGFEQGLVDFPARIDDQDVYLCWKSDEDAITWYHPVTEGFAGRRPIPAELLEAPAPAADEA